MGSEQPGQGVGTWLAAALAGALGAVALRQAMIAGLWLLVLAFGIPAPPEAGGAFWHLFVLVPCGLAVAFSVFLLGRLRAGGAPPTVRRVWVASGLVAAGLVVAVRHMEYAQGVYRWDYIYDRGSGRFPFDPGTSYEVERGGYVGVVHVGADGFRICTPNDAPQDGDVRVGLVGDSFTFGQAIGDEDSLCWQLRERLAVESPGRFHVHNYGQPGASVHSYVKTLDFVDERDDLDVALVGLLLQNDAEVWDVNEHRSVFRSTWFQSIGSFLEPSLALHLLYVFMEEGRAEFFDYVSIRQGMEDLAAVAEARKLPIALYFWDPSRKAVEEGWYDPYIAIATELDAQSEYVTYAGLVSGSAEGRVWFIPGDGHPTREGVAEAIERLLPTLRTLTEAAP